MSAAATSKPTFGTTGAYIRVAPSSGTLQSTNNYLLTGSSIAVPVSEVVAEAKSLIREAYTHYLHSIALPEIGDDYSDEEELAWNAFFARPDVQAELERLAEEAERQWPESKHQETYLRPLNVKK